MLSTAFLLATSLAVVQADSPLPADVTSQLKFMAGQWKAEGTFAGETWQGTSRRKLSKSKTALMMTSETNIMDAAGVTGWDPEKNELVETWYNSFGAQVVICYKVTSGKVWEGRITVRSPSGERDEDGTCQLEQTSKDSFTWTVKTDKMEAVSRATRVKRKK
jgi:hypothetical protein